MSAALDQATIDRLAEQGDQPAPLFVVDEDTRLCEECGQPYHRPDGRSRGDFAKRKFCSRSCTARNSNRGRVGGPPPATHCIRDHEYTPENTYMAKSGRRTCRECKRIRDRGKPRTRSSRYVPAAERTPSVSIVIPPKPPAAPRQVWRPGMGEDGTGEPAPGFAREVNVWAGVRRA